MATTVGSHSVSAFATPVNGGPLDANVVRGNDNTIRTAYVAHDGDPGIHVQSSSLASRPSAGTAGRKWITVDTGSYKLWYDDGTTWHEVGTATIDVFVFADENLVKGDVVKVTGYQVGSGAPRVAKVASATDVAFGIMNQAVASGATGYLTNTGLITDVNTNAFTVGTILYPSTSGGFTSTKPTSGNYQVVAYVLRQQQNNGVLYVEFSAPRIVERSNNEASTIVLRDASGNFAAGTITAGALTSTGLVTFASLKGTGATTVTDILNDNSMATASATTLATSSSVKAYVDAQVATADTLAEVMANGNTTGATDLIVNSGQKIRTPAVAAQDGTAAITIANSTGALTLNAALADSNLATIATAGKVSNSATTATATNTNSAIVARDGSGNFAAGTITATFAGNLTGNVTGNVSGSSGSTTGNAATATALQTARTINGTSFDGTANITVTADAGTLTGSTLASGVLASSLTSVGTLSSLTVSGNTIVGAEVFRGADNSFMRLAGGNPSATGAAVVLFGSTHATAPGRVDINATGTGTFNVSTGGVARAQIDASGNLAVDTNTLYVDAANNRVGIGTASPAFTLETVGGTGAVTLASFRTGDGTAANNAGIQFLATSSATASSRSSIIVLDPDGANVAGSDYFSIQKLGNNGVVSLTNFSASAMTFGTDAATKMTLDASGNLGLGVTPSAWASFGLPVIELPSGGTIVSAGNGSTIGSNWYYDGSFRYKANAAASYYFQSGGAHSWSTAPSGTAGDAITFTQAMTLDASGNLGIGATTPSYRLDVREPAGGQFLTLYGRNAFAGASDGAQVLLGNSANFTNGFFRLNGGGNSSQAGIGSLNIGVVESVPMAFYTNNTERARITSGGDFLIGSTSGSHKFGVSVASGADRDIAIFGVTGASNGFRVQWNHANLKTYVSISDIPTSSAGLPAGTLYSDGGTIKIA